MLLWWRLSLLETARLRLRRWQLADILPFAAMNADPAVMEYFPATITLEQTQLAIDIFEAHFAMHGFSFWAVEMKGSGDFVGNVGLEPYDLLGNDGDAPTPHVAIGWQLARAYWGQGLALEAAQAVRDYAKNHLKLNEIIAVMAEKNARSLRVCERLGMVRDASKPAMDPNFPMGHPLSSQVLYRLALR